MHATSFIIILLCISVSSGRLIFATSRGGFTDHQTFTIDKTWMQLSNAEITDITICYRVYIYMFYSESRIFKIIQEDVFDLWGSASSLNTFTMNHMIFTYNTTFWPRQWYPICILYDSRKESAQIFVSNKEIFTTRMPFVEEASVSNSYNKIQKIVLGAEFPGKIADFNIWSRLIEPSVIEEFTLCKLVSGNLFAWNTLKHSMFNKVKSF